MTKPSITKRSVKGAALTYNELDDNFQNLKDATLTITAGSGGTAVVADLNGTITLVAGTGISFTGDNSAKTITVTSSAGISNVVEDTTPQLGGNLDVNGHILTSTSNGNIELNPDGTGQVRLIADDIVIGDGTGTVTLNTNSGQILQLRDPFTDDSAIALGVNGVTSYGDLTVIGDRVVLTGQGTGYGYVTTNDSGTSLWLKVNETAGSASVLISGGTNGGVGLTAIGTGYIYANAPFRVVTLSTSDRDALTAVNGMVIYNTSTSKFQGRAGGTWVDLH